MSGLIANMELLLMVAILVFLLICFNMRYWKPKYINPLANIHYLVFVGCFLEMGAFWADGKPNLIWLNNISNILYLGSIGLIGACMAEYCSQQFPQPIWKNERQHLLLLLPIVFELICLATAPVTKLIFYVTPDGYYHRADTFFLQLIPYAHLLICTAYGVYWYLKTETTKERNEYLAIALFSLPPFLLGGTQLLIKANTLDILEFSVVISLLSNYAVSQNNRITRDPLTKLPNREVLDNIISDEIRNVRRDDSINLYVMMGDLDDFKQINDTYGHPEGDQALIAVADIIYAVSKHYRADAARLGGDEFTIICSAESEDTPKAIIREIAEALRNASEGRPYALRMSIGYDIYHPGQSISDILKAADKKLYEAKKHKHDRDDLGVLPDITTE